MCFLPALVLERSAGKYRDGFAAVRLYSSLYDWAEQLNFALPNHYRERQPVMGGPVELPSHRAQSQLCLHHWGQIQGPLEDSPVLWWVSPILETWEFLERKFRGPSGVSPAPRWASPSLGMVWFCRWFKLSHLLTYVYVPFQLEPFLLRSGMRLQQWWSWCFPL